MTGYGLGRPGVEVISRPYTTAQPPTHAIVPAMQDPPLTPAEKLRDELAALELATQRFDESFSLVAALLIQYTATHQ
jgi:hypothetical protein